jgi:signal transduction histidine kinase
MGPGRLQRMRGKGRARIVWFTLAGMAAGYLLVHPFAMAAYVLGPHQPVVLLDFSLFGRQVHLAFSRDMMAMAGAFSLMGGVVGFTLGAWYRQRERLARKELESQRHLAALETLHELMVTLAHHIRNANLVIGGFSAHLLKHLTDSQWQEQLSQIQQASREIEAVIASLEGLTEISTTSYTTDGTARMIDLKKELQARLAALQPPEADHET